MEEGREPEQPVALAAGYGIAVWSRFATSARWVSSTSFGRPVVPLEGIRSAMSSGSGRSAGGSPAAGQQLAELDHLDRARLGGRRAGGVRERADGDDDARPRAAQLVGELADREQRAGAA